MRNSIETIEKKKKWILRSLREVYELTCRDFNYCKIAQIFRLNQAPYANDAPKILKELGWIEYSPENNRLIQWASVLPNDQFVEKYIVKGVEVAKQVRDEAAARKNNTEPEPIIGAPFDEVLPPIQNEAVNHESVDASLIHDQNLLDVCELRERAIKLRQTQLQSYSEREICEELKRRGFTVIISMS